MAEHSPASKVAERGRQLIGGKRGQNDHRQAKHDERTEQENGSSGHGLPF
jgi:hypothetical protein